MSESYIDKSNRLKYKFVYKTTNKINGKVYVGYRCTDNLDDGYIGCGCYSQAHAEGSVRYGHKSHFLNAVVKHGYENFSREILFFFDTVEECIEKEAEIVNKDWIKSNKNYNLILGGGKPPNTTVTTPEQEEEIFKDYMEGMRKDDISEKYSISLSVIYRITKDRDTTGKKRSVSKAEKRVNKWIENNGQYYIEKYKNWEMSKSDIQKDIPIDLYKNDFLKDIKRFPRYVGIDITTEQTFFISNSKDIQKLPRMEHASIGYIHPVIEGRDRQIFGYSFVRYKDYLKGITSYMTTVKKHVSKYKGRVLIKDGKEYIIGDRLKEFCDEHGLCTSATADLFRGKRPIHKGFKVK